MGAALPSSGVQSDVPLRDVVGSFLTACKGSKLRPIIFIDEANIAFAAGETDDGAKERVKEVLNLFVRMTKQLGEAGIVLATSDHGFPFRLRRIGWDASHIKKTIVTEEVPPAEMLTLLSSSWGCGDNLARALMSLYGGHVMYIVDAVRELAVRKAEFAGVDVLGGLLGSPAECFSDETCESLKLKDKWERLQPKIMEALTGLVQTGAVPLMRAADDVAEVISFANVGTVVAASSIAAGVRPEAWQLRLPDGQLPDFLLIPSSNIMRLLLARKHGHARK